MRKNMCVYLLFVLGCLLQLPSAVILQDTLNGKYSLQCELPSYSVSEGNDVSVCVRFRGPVEMAVDQDDVTIDVNIATLQLTADETDYTPISNSVVQTFTGQDRGILDFPCVILSALTDNQSEDDETVMVVVNQTQPIQSVQNCTIIILDLDSQGTPPSTQDGDFPRTSGGQTGADNGSSSAGVIAGAVVGGLLGLVGLTVAMAALIVVCVVCCRRKKGKIHLNSESMSSGNLRPVVYKKNGDVESSVSDVSEEVNDLPMDNPVYSRREPPQYAELTRQDEVQSYPNWRQLFSHVTLSPAHLQFGDYLGEGAFGKVYQATLTTPTSESDRDVALKTLKDTSQVSEVEDFLAESAVMLDFRHPNVLNLIGVCFDCDNGVPVIVLPLMENGDLRSYLLKKRKDSKPRKHYPEGLSESALLQMCLEVALGMEYLANKKFIHRDLAARNCMVDSKLSVRVADFGRSRDVYNSDYYRLTHKQRLPVKWMAPESLFECTYTEKTDVWSYGVVCWEVFKLGKKPFSKLDNKDVPDHIGDGHRLDRPSRCPKQMYSLLLSMWDEDPGKRPSFSNIVTTLTQLTGVKEVNPPSEATPTTLDPTSPLYKNFPLREQNHLLISAVPEEYEVPISINGEHNENNENNEDSSLVYEVPLPIRSISNESASGCGPPSRSDSGPTEEERAHIYHTLEPQEA